MLQAVLTPGGLDEDSANGLGSGSEEVPPAVPVLRLFAADEPEVGLVDEGGGLEVCPGFSTARRTAASFRSSS